MTNLERIRTMSESELANFLCNISSCDEEKCVGFEWCRLRHKGTIDWLQQEHEEYGWKPERDSE